MIDLPEMAPCPVGRRGRHALASVFSSDAEHDLTMFCERCGMVRRLPMTGEVGVPLDQMDAAEIVRRIARAGP